MAEQLAFNALVDLAQRSLASAKGLPAQTEVRQYWSGIGFSLMGSALVSPMGEITELLELPEYTKCPGVQPWVLGVANVRGRLLPLFDMAAFFGGRLDGQRKKHRVLVLERDGFYAGLVVDAAMGMQHFPVESFTADAGEIAETLLPFVGGCYGHSSKGGDREWYVFNPAKLIEDPRFANAAR